MLLTQASKSAGQEKENVEEYEYRGCRESSRFEKTDQDSDQKDNRQIRKMKKKRRKTNRMRERECDN